MPAQPSSWRSHDDRGGRASWRHSSEDGSYPPSWWHSRPPPQPSPQQQARQPPQPVAWACAHCCATNWSPKNKCSDCGLRKSFSQVVRSWSPPQATQPSSHPVRAQLDKVTASLAGLHVSAAPTAHTQPAAAPAPAVVPSSRAKVSEQIKALESAIALMPAEPEFEQQCEALRAKAAALRREIIDAKPIGARIDGTRAALQRAQDRKAEAVRTLVLAQDAVSAADAETGKLACELAELEAALAHAPPEAMDTAPPVCSLDMLGSQLKQYISALKADIHIDPAHLTHAEAHVSQLIGGFEATLQHAGRAREAAGLPNRRIVGKQDAPASDVPVPTELVDVGHRLVGKQQPKRVITDFFKVRAAPYPAVGFPAPAAAEAAS